MKTKKRSIDRAVKSSFNWLSEKTVLMQKKNITTLKGLIIMAFVVGVIVALIWTINLNLESKSLASSNGYDSSIEGEFEKIIEENPEKEYEKIKYFVYDKKTKKHVEIKFKKKPADSLETGDVVRIKGKKVSEKVFEGDNVVLVSQAESLTDTRKAVVLMVDLLNAKASSRYTLDQISSVMYYGDKSVDSLYRESSRDMLGFEADVDANGQADVFGPFQVNYTNETCNYYDWSAAAETAATEAGIDLSLYQHRVFVLPHFNELPSCAWAGVANVGCGTFCRAWVGGADYPMLIAHELGHNLSMGHAATDPENDGVVNSVYGDYSDPMGTSSSAWHLFNAPHIDQMGWYSSYSGDIQTVATSGTYTLAPIGMDPTSTDLPFALKIAKPDTEEFYYLSYRQPLGYDSGIASIYSQGVNIHRYKGSNYGYTYFIQSLTDGSSFSDMVNGISVTQVSHSDKGVTFDLTVSVASDSTAPSVKISNPLDGNTISGVIQVDVTATDNIGVSKVELYVDSNFVAEDTSSPYSFSLDTKLYDDGSHAIKAVAYDASGNNSSNQISVNISNQSVSSSCGDGYCGGQAVGENCQTCPQDCASSTASGSCSDCFKGVCDGTCHPSKDGANCPDCQSNSCCGDGVCSAGEDCPVDCDCSSNSECSDGVACTIDTCLLSGVCQNIWPSCGLSDGCCGSGCSAISDPDCVSQDCSACFKGICDGTCHPSKDGAGCPDCQ